MNKTFNMHALVGRAARCAVGRRNGHPSHTVVAVMLYEGTLTPYAVTKCGRRWKPEDLPYAECGAATCKACSP